MKFTPTDIEVMASIAGVSYAEAERVLADVVDEFADDERDHLTCCIDEGRALCGRDISDLDYTDTLEDVCSACWKRFEDGDGKYCPRGWTCPDLS